MTSNRPAEHGTPEGVPEGLPEGLLDGWCERLPDEDIHHYLLRVHYEDTDLGGIVYHANYLKFAERARSAYLRLLGINQEDNLKTPPDVEPRDSQVKSAFVVRRAEIDFMQAAGLGDVLRVQSRVVSLSRVRLKIEQIIKNHQTGHILAGVFVDITHVKLDEVGAITPLRMADVMMQKFNTIDKDKVK
jgi:acyl-CoA thioester hydrolase